MDNTQNTAPQTPQPEPAAAKTGANGKAVRPMPNFGEMFRKMKMQTLLITLGVITGVVILFQVYFGLMSFAVDSVGLRIGIIFLALLWSVPLLAKFFVARETETKKVKAFNKVFWAWKIPAVLAVVVLTITISLAIFTTPLFIAKDFNQLIVPTQKSTIESDPGNRYGAFNADIPDFDTAAGTDDEMQVAIVDKAFAAQLGVKALGNVEGGLGSQYTIRDYTLINYKGKLQWIGAIEPKGFFQWTSSASEGGAPGYVLVDATKTDENASAELVMSHKMKYTPGAYLWNDVERAMYFARPASLRAGQINLELDETGVPYYTQAVYKKKFGITSGDVVVGLITLNATTGETLYYNIDTDIPSWIDRVQVDSITMSQLDYWGEFSHGYWNTVFAKKEVNATSVGYNYVYYDNALHLTTGFTSKSASDDAIIGTVMVDMRTNEASIYNMSGATEQAAMNSVQELGNVKPSSYKATFPALVNFNGVPTYYMGLKDSGQNIKMYAFVSVEKYTSQLVAAATPEAAMAAYREMIKDEAVKPPVVEGAEITTKIVDIRTAPQTSGYDYVIKGDDGKIYFANYTVTNGDKLMFALKDQTIKFKHVNNVITEVISIV